MLGLPLGLLMYTTVNRHKSDNLCDVCGICVTQHDTERRCRCKKRAYSTGVIPAWQALTPTSATWRVACKTTGASHLTDMIHTAVSAAMTCASVTVGNQTQDYSPGSEHLDTCLCGKTFDLKCHIANSTSVTPSTYKRDVPLCQLLR